MIKTLKMNIWGREFDFPVEYAPLGKKEVLEKLEAGVSNFHRHPEWLDNAKPQVEAHCRDAVMGDDSNPKKDNIFSYIIPEYIYVKNAQASPKVALVCRYRYDEEHGLIIVFQADGTIKIGGQDMPF